MSKFYQSSGASARAHIPKNRNKTSGVVLPPAAALSPAPVAGQASGLAAVRIPTVFTDESPRTFREAAIKSVDLEGEIHFHGEAKSGDYDADAERMLSWLLFQHAKDVLGYGKESRTLKDKVAPAPYSVLFRDRGIIGPVQVRTKRHSTVDGDGKTVQRLQHVHRVVSCLTRTVPKGVAEIWQHKASMDCSWHNVIVCGSPWECPLCSRRINKARQEQIKAVYEAFERVGIVGGAYMLTFTVQHGLGDACADTVARMKEAMQVFGKSHAFKGVTRAVPLKVAKSSSLPYMGYVGRIAALEVTHGNQNGWHPHEHHLWFFKRTLTDADVALIKKELFDAWLDACLAVGLQAPVAKFGLDIRRALSAADYLTKFGTERRWGPEKEIASSHSKKGSAVKGKGRTPMQILLDSFSENVNGNTDGFVFNADAGLFRDYAKAFKGRHQLQFSDSLRQWMRLNDVQDVDCSEAGDTDLASALDAESVLGITVSDADFANVVRHRAQFEVLRICKRDGFDAAVAYIASLAPRHF